MKHTHLLDMVEQIINKSPPADWQPMDVWGDYQGYGNLVEGVDLSNSGDVHEHGVAVGTWYVVCGLAKAMKVDKLEAEKEAKP